MEKGKLFDENESCNLFHNCKFIFRFVIVSLFGIIVLCIVLYNHEMAITEIDAANITMLTEKDGVILGIDTLNLEQRIRKEKELTISGWCVIPGKDTKIIENHVVFRDVETSRMYQLPTTIVARNDITTYINDGHNYDNAGFFVHLIMRDFKLEQKKYEICLLCEIAGEKYIIQTGQYLN